MASETAICSQGESGPQMGTRTFVGWRVESGEVVMMNENGVTKVRRFMRERDEERWKHEESAIARGSP